MKSTNKTKYIYLRLTKATTQKGIVKRFTMGVLICIEKTDKRVYVYKSRLYYKNYDFYHFRQIYKKTIKGGYAYGIEIVNALLQNGYIME